MRGLALLVLASPTLVFASADREDGAPPEPPPSDMTRIEGPFATLDAYCAFRVNQDAAPAYDRYDLDGTLIPPDPVTCPAMFDPDAEARLPRAGAGEAIRAYRFIEVLGGRHVVIQTAQGWFGREIGAAHNGDGVSVEEVRVLDLVRDAGAELHFTVTTTHTPCGCDDGPYFASTEMFVCTMFDDGPRCSDPIQTANVVEAVEVYAWSTSVRISRDGKVTPTLDRAEHMSRKQKRALVRPSRLEFRR
jgi:hypothetical protein